MTLTKKTDEFKDTYAVCSSHFSEEDYLKWGQSRRPTTFAVPSGILVEFQFPPAKKPCIDLFKSFILYMKFVYYLAIKFFTWSSICWFHLWRSSATIRVIKWVECNNHFNFPSFPPLNNNKPVINTIKNLVLKKSQPLPQRRRKHKVTREILQLVYNRLRNKYKHLGKAYKKSKTS